MIRFRRTLSLLLVVLSASFVAADGRPLADRPLAPTSYYTFRPVSAYAGGRFLTVWHESMGLLGSPIRGAFSDASGARISERSFSLNVPSTRDPFSYDLVGTGDSFTLFWRDGNGSTHMVDVDLEGDVTNPRTVALPDSVHRTIAWNGTHFLAVLQLPSTYTGAVLMFDREGRIVLPLTTLPGYTYAFDVAVADGRFVALTSGFDALVAQAVTPEGVGPRRTVDTSHTVSSVTFSPSRVVTTPAASGDVLVVWALSGGEETQLKSAIVRADGTHTPASVLLTGPWNTIPLEVLRSGDGYVLVYAIAETAYRIRLDASGAHAGEAELVASNFNGGLSAAAGPGAILVPFNTAANALADIATVTVPATGPVRAPEIVSINFSRQLQPVLGTGASSDVLAVWTEIAADVPVVRATPVDWDAAPGPAVQIAPGMLASKETAWNRTHHLVIHRDETRLLATRVAADGTPQGAPIVLASLTAAWSADAAVVWLEVRPSSGSRWLVVWSDGKALHSLTVSRDGTPSATQTLNVHPPLPEGFIRIVGSPRLSFDGSEVLLVWAEAHRHEDDAPWAGRLPTKTWATRLTRSGAPEDQQAIDLDLDARSLSVASSGSDFLVVGDQHARFLKGDGPLRITASRELFGWPALSDVIWNDSVYVVALRYFGADWYLGVLRLESNGNTAGAPRASETLPPDEEAPPSVAGRQNGNALVALQEGTFDDGASATVYAEQELGFMPLPPGPPRNVHVRQFSSSVYEVNWDAPAGGEPDGYVVEQLILDEWRVVARVQGDTRRANVSVVQGVPRVRARAFNAGGPSAPTDDGSGRPRRRAVR